MILDKPVGDIKIVFDTNQDDDEDPFNRFWDAVEGLVQKISGPVAFTTAPLNVADQTSSGGSSPAGSANISPLNSPITQSTILSSYLVIPPGMEESRLENPLYTNAQRSGLLIRSQKTIEEYEIENKQLKHTIDLLSKRVLELEQTQHENTMLRSSIIQFRQEIQKQVFEAK